MEKVKVILASSSKQRQDIFKMIGLKYEVVKSLVDEDSNKTDPNEYVEELSRGKAESVAEQINEKAIIISADTIVYFDGNKYEKPKTKEEIVKNIKAMSNKTNKIITGITIKDLYKDKTITFSSSTEVKFRELTDEEINWYVEGEKNIFKCCGYVPHGKAAVFIDWINGDYNTMIGISPSLMFSKLKQLGYTVSNFEFEE